MTTKIKINSILNKTSIPDTISNKIFSRSLYTHNSK